MTEQIKNIELIHSAAEATIDENRLWRRKSHVFIFRTGGSVIYTFDEKQIIANKGDVVFIPGGVSYKAQKTSDAPCRYTVIAFEADIKTPMPAVFNYEAFPEAEYICTHFPEMMSVSGQTEKLKCMALFYSFLAYISGIENEKYQETKKLGLIRPATEYLKENIFNANLNVKTLHLMCGISDTYFRKIFESKYKMTPQKYITNKRISKAKSIIDSGEFESVNKIAFDVGYSDPLYFGKAFKKKYGVSPAKMMKTYK